MRSVLQEHTDHLSRLSAGFLRRLLDDPEPLDVALVLEDPRNLRFQLAGRHVDAGMLRRHGIAEAREHVRNRVCHISVLSLKPYQELFVTPVTSPSSASLRKHRRHMSNLRMNARGRPQSLQRLRCRILYFSAFSSLATLAVVAIYVLANSSGTACPLAAAACALLRRCAPSSRPIRSFRAPCPPSCSRSRGTAADRGDPW